jgi:hypothetical protein
LLYVSLPKGGVVALLLCATRLGLPQASGRRKFTTGVRFCQEKFYARRFIFL